MPHTLDTPTSIPEIGTSGGFYDFQPRNWEFLGQANFDVQFSVAGAFLLRLEEDEFQESQIGKTFK